MLDSDSFTIDMLSNPAKLSKVVIDAMEASDTGGGLQINDPNNGFVMQLLASMAVYSKFSEKIDYVSSFFYPQRARNAQQLFPRLSEFDYVKLMASPATLPFVFALSKEWIIDNAVYFDTNYNKLEIPATSYITMGGIVYSMYHPIQILVNRNTGALTAFYDTTKDNSLNVLSTNMLLAVDEYNLNGISWFQITFNMYQFERSVETYTVSSEQGFIKNIQYNDQFYAVKVFTQNRNGSLTELKYSFSQLYYDYQTPTVIISLQPDSSQVNIQIPQIYFDNNQISQTIKIELYTTKGSVNYSISSADVQGLSANFDTKSSSYAAPLEKAPSYILIPRTTQVAGGSNSMSYEEIRDAIVNQRLYDRVAVTTPEVIQAGLKAGFNLSRIVDDLTERIYYASNILTDDSNMVIPTFTGTILIANDSLNGNPSTILKFTNNYYTILPTTLFKANDQSVICTPLTDGEVNTLSLMTKSQLVTELNKGNYLRQPFHITLRTDTKSPKSSIYNLLSPKITNLIFDKENPHSAPQMSAIAVQINHLNKGTGGYEILLSMVRSSNIEANDINNFKVFLTTYLSTGALVYLPTTYVGTDENDVDIWRTNLSTNYNLTEGDNLTVLMYDEENLLNEVNITLESSFNIVTAFVRNFDTTIPIDAGLNNLLPSSFRTNHVGMAQQRITVSLGVNLSNQIYTSVNTNWGNDVYQVADQTIYHITQEPIFQYTEAGIINTRFNATSGHLEVVELYQIGDTPAAFGDFSKKLSSNIAVPASGVNTTLNLNNTTGILVGMHVRGTNLPLNSKVVSKSGNTVVISGLITSVLPQGQEITFTNPTLNVRTTVVQSAAGNQLTIADTSQLLVGQSVMGFDIPSGAVVSSIVSGTVFTISIPTTKAVAANTILTIINKTAPGVIKTAQGEIVRDETGLPILVKAAQNQYSIPAILFDGRLFASEDPTDQQIVNVVANYLENYANQISTIDAGLLENTQIFYRPMRTMGYAAFNIGAGQIITMPLELSFEVFVYVDASVYNTQPLLSTMSKSIINVINQNLNNDIISISDLADKISVNLGSNAAVVELGYISGREGLRLISLKDSGSRPSIENILTLNNDGTIIRVPNVKINYLRKPDTSEIKDMNL